MKITVEIEIDDEIIEHHSVAEKTAHRVLEALDDRFVYHFNTPTIEVKWEFGKASGSITNERNPS